MTLEEVRRFIATVSVSEELSVYLDELRDWVDTVESHSAGWAHWAVGRNAGTALAKLLKRASLGERVPTHELNQAFRDICDVAARAHRTRETLWGPVDVLE